MRNGMDPTKAAALALGRIIKIHSNFEGAVVAVNTAGEYGMWAVYLFLLLVQLDDMLVT